MIEKSWNADKLRPSSLAKIANCFRYGKTPDGKPFEIIEIKLLPDPLLALTDGGEHQFLGHGPGDCAIHQGDPEWAVVSATDPLWDTILEFVSYWEQNAS